MKVLVVSLLSLVVGCGGAPFSTSQDKASQVSGGEQEEGGTELSPLTQPEAGSPTSTHTSSPEAGESPEAGDISPEAGEGGTQSDGGINVACCQSCALTLATCQLNNCQGDAGSSAACNACDIAVESCVDTCGGNCGN